MCGCRNRDLEPYDYRKSVPEFISVHTKMIVEHRDIRRRDSSKLKVHMGKKEGVDTLLCKQRIEKG